MTSTKPFRIAIALGLVAFIVGAGLGTDQGGAPTSRSAASAVLLTVGLLTTFAAFAAPVIRQLRDEVR